MRRAGRGVLILLAVLAALVQIGCLPRMFDNPLDPGSPGYGGVVSGDSDGDGVGQYADVDEITLVSPADGVTVASLTPTLTIYRFDPTRISLYWIEISTATGPAFEGSRVLSKDDYVGNACVVPVGVLGNGQTYYWRARAFDGANWSDQWSEVRSFEIQVTVNVGHPSPADGAVLADTTPLLDWDDADGATTYQVQMSASEGFASPLLDRVDLSASQLALTAVLSDNTTYYWRVRAQASGAVWGDWWGTWSFSIDLPAAQHPSPVSGTSIGDGTPQVDWEDVPGATGYRIQISVDQALTSQVVDDTGVTFSTYQVPTALANGATYYWRVKACNGDGVWGDWSTTWTFTVDVSLQVATIPSPPSGSGTADTTPTFDWEDVSGAAGYRIQLGIGVDFANTVVDDATLSTSGYTASTLLADNATYHWRVMICNADGIWGSWSAAWTLSIDIPTPVLTSPADGSTTSDTTPLLDWDDVAGVTGYQVQASTSSIFASTVVDDAALSSSEYPVVVVLADNTTYYWRVRARNADGIWGDWSTSRAFGVNILAPTLLSPSDGITTFDGRPTFDWSDVAGAAGYRLQLSTSALFETVVVDDDSLGVSWYTVGAVLADNTTYYWRVRSRNGDGIWGLWAAARTLSVYWDVDYGIVDPADGGNTRDTTPLLDWGSVSGAAGYEVQIATSGAGLDVATPLAASGSYYEVLLSSVFAFGDEVFWRLRAVNGDGVSGAWSSTHHFSMLWTVDYGTLTPADGGAAYDTTPLLDWAEVPGASSYEVQIAASVPDLETAAPQTTSGSQYQVQVSLALGSWYWRLRPVNSDGVPAEWSTPWSFQLASIVPLASVVGGNFQMGSTTLVNFNAQDEQPVHSVTVSNFLIAKYEVTQAQYQTVMGSNPSWFTSGADAPNRPVEQVTWYDAVAFCNALSAREGLTACYAIDGTTVTADFSKKGYRLPTEAEWEFAARGGAASEGYWYAGSDDVDAVAWYDFNATSTQPVGTKAANELGIYDMSGNADEWCNDWYGSYGPSAQTDPTGPSSGSWRVRRGGSWGAGSDIARVAKRGNYGPGYSFNWLGFRPVRRP